MVESPSPPPPPPPSPPPPTVPIEALDRRRTLSPPSPNPNHHRNRRSSRNSLSPSATPPPHSPPPRRRDRHPRERKDSDRDFDYRPPPPPNRYYDRNRDRDRDYRDRGYKRRFSSSPPPPPHVPPYRDNRRHFSPPFPPPFKRRRDDGGGYFNGRRRSPRGGFGYGYGGDRRFGNRFPGGYERDMGGRGGRGGYAGDWPRGRYRSGGYQGGPSDWNSSNSGFGDSSNAGNFQREGLMTYKQFIQELEDDILPSEAESRYQEYKSEYISTLKRTYFETHKDEEWLRNKYHPTNLLSVIERRNERARQVAKDILLDLHSGTLDLGPGVHVSSTNKSGQTSEPNSEDETDVSGKRRRHSRSHLNKADLLAARKAPTVSSEPRRIQIDIEQAQAIIAKLDSEKGIEDNILSTDNTDSVNGEKPRGGSIGPVVIIHGLTSVKGLEGAELLDTLVTYLWRVHGVDYYGMIETEEPNGLRHVRSEGKGLDISSNVGEWEKKLDLHWQERLRGWDPLEMMTAKEKIDAAAVESLEPSVRKIRDEKYGWKYGCGAKGCTKLFHAPEFVHKHLKLKHPDLVMELTSKVREDIYFQNYMNDPDAPGGQPVMQQFVPKEKMQRRRPGPDNYPMDDRGPQSDRDRNGSERFDRQENSTVDFTSNKDTADKANTDKPTFDNFAGQGISVGPFAPDMAPPQLLMPVPGAGPLGPFVPAPPEVAMQMLRKQGGSILDGPGRSGLPGGPIILPPTLPQDPRRLRSYRDLDAPDDEVTVMDYRSL